MPTIIYNYFMDNRYKGNSTLKILKGLNILGNNLFGKVALITGGSRGIGLGIVNKLVEEGVNIAFTYEKSKDAAKSIVKQIKELDRKALAIKANSTNPEEIIQAVNQTVVEFGRLDILVNNAGIFPYGPYEEVTLEEFDNTLTIHVKAVFVAIQAATLHMQSGGRIINIGSSLAERVPEPGVALYAMSKSALSGLTRGIARDLGSRNITINTVNPGSTDTDMISADGPGAKVELKHIALSIYGMVVDIVIMYYTY